jgi:hypothetical protein
VYALLVDHTQVTVLASVCALLVITRVIADTLSSGTGGDWWKPAGSKPTVLVTCSFVHNRDGLLSAHGRA